MWGWYVDRTSFCSRNARLREVFRERMGHRKLESVKWRAVCSQVAASILGEVCNVLQTDIESFSEAVFGSFCWFLDRCQSF